MYYAPIMSEPIRSVLVLALIVAIAGCDARSGGPFDRLPLESEFSVGLDGRVHVARDRYGVAHISASTVADAAFVQGYVMAHDRLPQMDLLRRFGAGTLSELFGALDASVIETDLEMRMHRMRPLAEATWETLRASTDPVDAELVQLLQRFADGVNAYAADLNSGRFTLDLNLLVSFDPARFVPWTPIDSLVLGRFQAFALSWSAPVEIELTEMYQKLRDTFDAAPPGDAAAYARRGLARDFLRLTPVGVTPTIDGAASPMVAPAPRANAVRPRVPQPVLDRARNFFARHPSTGAFGAPGPHALMAPYAGSNNWAVGPSRANGRALLAGDQHLSLPNPSVFYPTHLIIGNGDGVRDPDEIDLLGVTFPGIPGVILGSNGDLAWSATVSYHDVNDVYLETITPCAGAGGGDCVAFAGGQVPIETFTEQIGIGALGTLIETRTATYEVVPHHGPIIPDIVDGAIVPRTANQALSVRYTGHEPTFEIRAIWRLARAKTVADGYDALADLSYGSQNWTMIDNTGSIGWTMRAHVPVRAPAALTWHATQHPDGAAPFFILSGDGTAEWEGRLDHRFIPHAIDPESAMIVTANSDPVGATFDGDPFNEPLVEGRPRFLSATYAPGLRTEQITNLLERAGTAMTLDDMARIQHDSSSTVGAKLAPAIVAAFAQIDAGTAPADALAYVAALPAIDRTRLATARGLLERWTFATPAAIDAPDPDSAATAVFNAWMHFFITGAFTDELAAAGFELARVEENLLVRWAHAALVLPGEMVASETTGQPIACDRMTDPGPDGSCTALVMRALLAAMQHLESTAGFGTADTSDWRWGKLHRLTMSPLFPNRTLELPGPNELSAPGFPQAGDTYVVNVADAGWKDLDFRQHAHGPAQRFLASSEPGRPISVKWQLPTGVIYDSRSSHYRDLLDEYYLPQVHFDAPYLIPEIVDAGEVRWEFR